MSAVGVLWLILIVLKVIGVAYIASWPVVILWPLAVFAIIAVLVFVFGVSIVGFSTLRRR